MRLDHSDNLDIAAEREEQMRVDAVARLRRAAEAAAARPESAECEDCGVVIPLRRRELVPGCRTCVDCQAIREGRK